MSKFENEVRVMRLFVWSEFDPDYHDGLAFAIAETVEQAKELVVEQYGSDPDDWGSVQEFDCSSAVAFSVVGGM